jgi:tetratricopeptide (TPR) repeat protein
MSRGDWFRHTEWDAEIQAGFDARLLRARDKVQPLKIQAALLAKTRPDAALRLLDRYFESGDTLFLADAYHTQAQARVALGDFSNAAESYVAALTREAEFSNLKTNSFVEYPLLVAEHRLIERYGDALRVLAEQRDRLTCPVQHFMWHAARALILSAQGEPRQAQSEAQIALAAADQSSSGFRFHQSLGLVGDSYHELRERLRDLLA